MTVLDDVVVSAVCVVIEVELDEEVDRAWVEVVLLVAVEDTVVEGIGEFFVVVVLALFVKVVIEVDASSVVVVKVLFIVVETSIGSVVETATEVVGFSVLLILELVPQPLSISVNAKQRQRARSLIHIPPSAIK